MNTDTKKCIKYSKKGKGEMIMNTLLIFFAIPLAVIIFSIALQKILKCPPLVASIILAIGIIVTFIISNLIFLVATLIYTIISYITAVITCIIMRYFCNDRRNSQQCNRQKICTNQNNNELLTIDSNFPNGDTENLLTISSNSNVNNSCTCGNNNQVNTINGVLRITDNNDNNGNCCYSNNNDTNEFSTRINIVPNISNNGRTGCICGRYRRR